ncbi:hypothetical protein CISIN_1g0336611mg, partial [Citrus sinensis]
MLGMIQLGVNQRDPLDPYTIFQPLRSVTQILGDR